MPSFLDQKFDSSYHVPFITFNASSEKLGLVKSEPIDDYFIYCHHSSVLQQSRALSLLASLVFERENGTEGAWNPGKFDNALKFGSSTDLQFYTKGKRVKFLSDQSIPSKCNQFY